MTLARRGRARSVSRHDSFPSMERVREALSAALGDRYRIERVLGRGGMATVYVAEDLRHSRQVAIKVLRPDVAAAIGAERFLREIAIAARLTHPHVLPLIDSGQADGSLYYVMPYVRGETLRERLVREQRFALKDALRIARELGAGLDYAHREGFVHRDVKPENVLLADGHAVLADFGIARAIFQAGGEHVTEVGLAIGTPEYMSPEQAAGDRELDGRCDEYALACVVYEMVAGEPPFSGDSARAIVAKHLSEPPAAHRLSHVRLRLERTAAGHPRDRRAARRLRRAGRDGAAVRRPAAHHGAARRRRGRTRAVVGALRSYAGRRLRDPGRDRPHHRQYAAHHLPGRHRRPTTEALHPQPRGVFAVPEGPLLLEQAQSGGRARGDFLLQAGDRPRSRLRAGVLRPVGCVRPPGGLPQRAGHRGVPTRARIRAQGAGPGPDPA